MTNIAMEAMAHQCPYNHQNFMGTTIPNNIIYHLVMTNIAMENPANKWMFLAGKIIYKYGLFSMAMLNNQRVNDFMADGCTFF